MEKIYIPTSSLNFNNILATESISPKSFYQKRNFGYKRFNTVAPNPFVNSILAYSKIPIFSIDDTDFDDYPLVIEVSSVLVNKDSIIKVIDKQDIKIYQIESTIYFHPNKIRILFFSERQKNICFIKAEPSIETKLIPIYEPTVQVMTLKNKKNSFNWNESIISSLNDVSGNNVLSNIDLDSKLDKIKGFYFSYYLGIVLTQSIVPLSILEEFKHIENNIIIYFDKKEKSISINNLVGSIYNIKARIDNAIGNKEITSDTLIEAIFLDESDIKNKQKLLKFLKKTKPGKYDFYDQLEWYVTQKVKRDSNNKISFLLDNLCDFIKINNSTPVLLKKTKRIAKLISVLKEKEIVKEDPLFVVNNIHFNAFKLTTFIDNHFQKKGAILFKNIINEILDYPINDTQSFKGEKVKLAYEIGSVLSEYIKDWQNSNERIYFNTLMDNIENYKPFDLKSHPKEILQSIAIFIQKGEDPEKLLNALEQNNISDYRTALSLWGAIFGFSALPKTLTNILFSEKNSHLLIPFYQDVYKKLHNIDSNSLIIITEGKKKSQLKNVIKKPDIESIPTPAKSSEESAQLIDNAPKCPKCNSDMVLRNGKFGKFYGCSRLFEGCSGTRSYPLKDDIKKTAKSNNDDIIIMIIEYVKKYGHCKISDLMSYLKDKSKKRFNVGDIKNIITENQSNELTIDKIGNANSVRLVSDSVQTSWIKVEK